MKLKRLFATAISFIIGIAAFAQNSDYSSLLTKAKEYETQNKWVYAAATYFDAMVQNPTAQGIDAYTGFNEILELFYNGNPGKGEFDDFTKADAWLALAKEAEEYFDQMKEEKIQQVIDDNEMSEEEAEDYRREYSK